ncbi:MULTISPECIES: response regulator transcription factor [Prolixibacter]|jgi:two-component system alkaline phosphatase synthesis response regulator PhoP|uniref:Phosphate regulon transcriptional regulatory protein PhoB n=1 Tax=Prolixibacter denitrificans TaxID=1541063 RepID=A0A2P8CHJ7_9BACT|nr:MULTISPECIES: response regulator transcription factor [Prolixibacter]PSK84409.1 two-component system alkaline phosphatase synthesis response regulator PhoP [Prolixibacter denitrificans]GET20583.1 DNA-binding response regulator [Prolixibacter denitrificans]GET27249.1 DNA-binding response regulator [Prolixibacter sp. NT017]
MAEKENNYKILLVDDEEDILEFISYNLEREGFKVYSARNGVEAIKMAEKKKPDLIILDVMMPEMDGIVACEEIRKIPSCKDTVIAFLTARGEDYSQIAGFEAGADDYITKPIRPKVLISRVKALLKRSGVAAAEAAAPEQIITIGNLTIDKERYLLKIDDKEMILPRKEFELLSLLVSKPEKVFTREEIYNAVWGENVIVGDRTIDVHIRKLREKIGNDHIKTLKGIGYKFVN